jgi:hypothetical protein
MDGPQCSALAEYYRSAIEFEVQNKLASRGKMVALCVLKERRKLGLLRSFAVHFCAEYLRKHDGIRARSIGTFTLVSLAADSLAQT